MESVVVQQFKIKCQDCPYRGTASTKELAISYAETHISRDWRSGNDEHTVKITEVLLVSKKEDEEE